MTKDRPCHKHEVSSLIQDILKVTYDSLQSLPKKYDDRVLLKKTSFETESALV